MEDGLRDSKWITWVLLNLSLNPCYNGRYSKRQGRQHSSSRRYVVLILVIMEDTLGDQLTGGLHYEERVLILIIMEDAL